VYVLESSALARSRWLAVCTTVMKVKDLHKRMVGFGTVSVSKRTKLQGHVGATLGPDLKPGSKNWPFLEPSLDLSQSHQAN